jgi:hypothetical protein
VDAGAKLTSMMSTLLKVLSGLVGSSGPCRQLAFLREFIQVGGCFCRAVSQVTCWVDIKALLGLWSDKDLDSP